MEHSFVGSKHHIKLATLFDLEKIELGLYRGQSWDLGFRALFGGQVLAQALTSASKTVESERVCHSFHSYFLLPGDARKPVVYDVENIRDGKSFSVRRVKAVQNGKSIFYMTASFQIDQPGVSHQYAAIKNDLPKPESLEPDIAKYEKNKHTLSEKMREVLSYHKPIDIRTIPPKALDKPEQEPSRGIWLKANELLASNGMLNQAALAYASDYHFLTTSLKPHNIEPSDASLQLATIDHAMWFHKPINFNDWLYYSVDSPFSGNSRGYVKGQFFNKNGELVASATQEGLIRQRATSDIKRGATA